MISEISNTFLRRLALVCFVPVAVVIVGWIALLLAVGNFLVAVVCGTIDWTLELWRATFRGASESVEDFARACRGAWRGRSGEKPQTFAETFSAETARKNAERSCAAMSEAELELARAGVSASLTGRAGISACLTGTLRESIDRAREQNRRNLALFEAQDAVLARQMRPTMLWQIVDLETEKVLARSYKESRLRSYAKHQLAGHKIRFERVPE